ncbi:MAG: hypothetical protein ACRES7_02265 [Gammaproteobacteria bacterium]
MSNNLNNEDRLFELLARLDDTADEERASSRLKSRLYSALMRQQEQSGPLRGLGETLARGYGLCVFEDVWQRAVPLDAAQRFNCCKPCRVRVLAEHVEGAPIHWRNCPYVDFGGTGKG